MYKVIDINFMLNSLLPKEIKVDITIDDIGLKSNLTTNQANNFNKKKSFFI